MYDMTTFVNEFEPVRKGDHSRGVSDQAPEMCRPAGWLPNDPTRRDNPLLVLPNTNLVPWTQEEEDLPERRRPVSEEVDSAPLLKLTNLNSYVESRRPGTAWYHLAVTGMLTPQEC